MTRRSSEGNYALIPTGATLCDIVTDRKAAKTLDNAKGHYPHVLHDDNWRTPGGKHPMVLIRCTHPGCQRERAIFTSDWFQVSPCAADRKVKAPTITVAEAKLSPRERVRSKDAPKGDRRAPKARKGGGRGRKGKRFRTREDFVAAATGEGE